MKNVKGTFDYWGRSKIRNGVPASTEVEWEMRIEEAVRFIETTLGRRNC